MNARYTNSDQNGFTMHDQRLFDLLVDRHLLDLLVDGELAEDQRRELLAGLDHTPDGWRRCALAFLEAQSWQREMGAVVREPMDNFSESAVTGNVATSANVKQPIIVGSRQSASKVRAFSMPLAIAASLLVAFALGLAVRPTITGGANRTTNGDASDRLDSTSAVQLAVQSSEDNGVLQPADQPLSDDDGAGRWGTVKLVVDRGPDGTLREVELPAVESGSWDESLFTSSPAVISPELQQVFERLGHQVRQERELVSYELKDGRQMVVPVDKVSFTPVAMRSYQ